MDLTRLRAEWFGNIRGDLLAGIVVALALIPEAIAFSISAGVDPKVGLYASFSIAVITAIVGGRPGMISAATAAMAVVMITLVRDRGLEYLLAATVLTGVLQMAAGVLRLGSLMRFISRSVMTGFVNALAILIFLAQIPELVGVPGLTYFMVVAGLAIIYLMPRLTKAIPSPLVAIVALTAPSPPASNSTAIDCLVMGAAATAASATSSSAAPPPPWCKPSKCPCSWCGDARRSGPAPDQAEHHLGLPKARTTCTWRR